MLEPIELFPLKENGTNMFVYDVYVALIKESNSQGALPVQDLEFTVSSQYTPGEGSKRFGNDGTIAFYSSDLEKIAELCCISLEHEGPKNNYHFIANKTKKLVTEPYFTISRKPVETRSKPTPGDIRGRTGRKTNRPKIRGSREERGL